MSQGGVQLTEEQRQAIRSRGYTDEQIDAYLKRREPSKVPFLWVDDAGITTRYEHGKAPVVVSEGDAHGSRL